MKTITISALTAIIAVSLIFSVIGPAHAATIEDGRNQLSPKAFGVKTKLVNGEDLFKNSEKTHKGTFDKIKTEQTKSFKKASEYYKALKFMKTYYNI